jgi:hypothetical protein
MEQLLYEGALEKIDIIFNERVKRFKQLAIKMEKSLEIYKSLKGKDASKKLINQKSELFENIQNIENSFNDSLSYTGDEKKKDEFLKALNTTGKDYISEIKDLSRDVKKAGTSWLFSIVENTRTKVLKHLPSFV